MPETVSAKNYILQSTYKQIKENYYPPSIIIEAHGLNDTWELWKKSFNEYFTTKSGRKIIFGGYFILAQKNLCIFNHNENDESNNKKSPQKLMDRNTKKNSNKNRKKDKDNDDKETKEYLGFHNIDLFTKFEWDILKKKIQKDPDIMSTANPNVLIEKIKNILSTAIQNKVASLLKDNKSVIFAINFSNNQDDFRHQGAELKHVIDFVRPASHRKVDVVAHSMGCLATASYIAGIAGVPFTKDIDQFVALGAPFNGSGFATPGKPIGDSLDRQLQKQQQHGFIDPYKNKRSPVYPVISDARLNPTRNQPKRNEHLEGFRTRGPAYEYLQKNSAAIKDLQNAWPKRYPASGVRAYSLQSAGGDYVVSDQSAFSLPGTSNYIMEKVFHIGQVDTRSWQDVIYNILAEVIKYRPNELHDCRPKYQLPNGFS